jgi:secreted Zn-dependent insulinase-like peptidase
MVARPKGDDRNYKYTVLSNGLKVVNVQDTRSLRTAFAVAVMSGSFEDPQKLPGLAHFCEHMLFLGTKSYPEASGFDEFMSANGGYNNAYTADEVTVYYAELSSASSHEGMDRFSDFFRAPLFQKKYVEKEVHAIGSEHAKNVQDSQRRILQVAYSLANPESPVVGFHTGDVETLLEKPKQEGLDPVEQLKVYFNSFYCPARMRLVTYGPGSLEDQLSEAEQKFGNLTAFSSNCTAAEVSFAKPEPWGPARMGQFVTVQGSLPQAQLWLHFPMPDVSKNYLNQPLQYMDYVLSYRGVDSLIQTLQDNLGLVSSCQPMFDASSAGTNLFVVMELSGKGQKQVELIMSVFYAYVATLRQKGVDTNLYDSLSRVAKLSWDWSAPAGASDTASALAEAMTRLPPKFLLSGDSLIEQPNASLVQSLMDYIRPDNMNVIYVDPPAAHRKGDEPLFLHFDEQNSETLPHYGVKYSLGAVNDVMPDGVPRWSSWIQDSVVPDSINSLLPADTQINLGSKLVQLPIPPKAIEGVPSDISLAHMNATRGSTSDAKMFGIRPVKLDVHAAKNEMNLLDREFNNSTLASINEKSVSVWYRSGWVTKSPKVQLQMSFRVVRNGSVEHTSAEDSIRLGLFSRLLSEAMVPKMVDLTATGVTYSIDVSDNGLSLSFGGFAPLLPKLVKHVLEELNSFNGNASATKPARFNRVMQEIRDEMKTYGDMPVSYAIADRNLLLQPDAYSRDETLAALDKVTLDSAASSVNDLVWTLPVKLTSLAMGNLGDADAKRAIFQGLGGLRMPANSGLQIENAGEPEIVTPVVNIAKPFEVRSKNPRAGDPNDVVVVSLIAGVSTIEKRVVLELLGKVLATVAYNDLRTARQLGYVVSAGSSQVSNVQYVSCIVQGTAMKADEVEAAIESVYMDLMPKRLNNMSHAEFLSYKDALRQELLEPPTSPQDEVSHYWGPVAQGGKCFGLRENMLRHLESSLQSKSALLEQWAQIATPSDSMRKKMVVKYFADQVPARPTEEVALASWKKQGVPDSAFERLRSEYQMTTIFDRADSKTRQQLVKEGGYFPRTLNCGNEEEEAVALGPAPAADFLQQAQGVEESVLKKAPAPSPKFLSPRHAVLQPE